MCTVGTAWKSASVLPGSTLASTEPTPPTRATSALLATRSTMPRSQTTIVPRACARASVPGVHSAAFSGSAPALATSAASTSGDSGTPSLDTMAPTYSSPFPSTTEPW